LDRACIINERTSQLTGYSNEEFRENRSLWINRIHPADHGLFSNAWKELQNREKRMTCDYRFFPKGQKKAIRLRDMSVSYPNLDGKIDRVISNYTNISDLELIDPEIRGEREPEHIVGLASALVHEIQGSLHTIKMGIDLVCLDPNSPWGHQGVIHGIERLNKLSRELGEYFVPPRTQLTAENPDIPLGEVVQHMEEDLHRQGIRFRMVRRNRLPIVRLDLAQFRNALRRVVEFCQILLPDGGEVEIETGQKNIKGQEYVELKIASSSTSSLEVEENEAFQPFLQVKNKQIGLSMVLAQDILRRHQGKIFFRKENPQRGVVTILLKVCSD
jgi:hypothetical protein